MEILFLKALAWGLLTFLGLPTIGNMLRGNSVPAWNFLFIGFAVAVLFLLYNL